jgi:hypothetical protein
VEFTKKRHQEAKQRRRELGWVEDANRALERLEALESEYENIDARASELTQSLHTSRVCHQQAERLSNAVLGASKQVQIAERLLELDRKIVNIRIAIEEAKQKEAESCRLKREADRAEKELEKKLGGRCPLCGAQTANRSQHCV